MTLSSPVDSGLSLASNVILEKYEKPPLTRDQVKSSIAPMKKEHEAQREALYDLQVEQMARLAKDQFLQVDATISWTDQERISLLVSITIISLATT